MAGYVQRLLMSRKMSPLFLLTVRESFYEFFFFFLVLCSGCYRSWPFSKCHPCIIHKPPQVLYIRSWQGKNGSAVLKVIVQQSVANFCIDIHSVCIMESSKSFVLIAAVIKLLQILSFVIVHLVCSEVCIWGTNFSRCLYTPVMFQQV